MRNSVLTWLALLTLAIAGAGGGVAEGAEEFATRQARREQEFPQQIRPLLTKYCYGCHNDQESQGDLSLSAVASPLQIMQDRKRWLTLVNKLAAKEMPPEDAEIQPSDAERKMLVDWLGALVDDLDCSGSPNPGRVTLRRLNRREYRNTVRDLTGVDYEPSAEFPGDDTGYGFDNIGDVMSLPPILMEKYLAAAEEIASQAIDAQGGKLPLDERIVGHKLEGAGQPEGSISRMFLTEGEGHTTLEAPADGQYEVRVMAYGDQAGTEPVKMALRIAGQDLQTFEVKARQSESREYVAKAEIKAGKQKLAVAFLNDFWNANESDPEKRDRNLIVSYVHIRGPLGGEARDLPASHRKLIPVQPGGNTRRRDATKQVVRSLASRGFRRPATDDEVDRLVALANSVREENGTFEQGIQLALQAVLCSPHFLFRGEPASPTADGKARDLNDYELATRLSYFLWSSMPDEELFRLAKQSKLNDPEVLEQQVRRMLADAKSQALVENFAGQWLELRSLEMRAPDPQMFPMYNAGLRQAMRTETEMFVAAIVREDRSVLELLDADFTFVNEPLAKLYGLKDVSGSEFRRVSLAGTERGGLLTQASVLTVTSNPNRTSPVKRGKWILENLLGTPPPPAPPDVPQLAEKGELKGTLRQRFEQHRANPACASCHERMDPLGFALENYDAIGGYRTTDGGSPVDASGKLPSGKSFVGARELRKVLLEDKHREQFAQCLTEKLLIYALGRGLDFHDQCTVDEIQAAVEKDGFRFSRLAVEIVRSDLFTKQATQRELP